MIEEHGSPLPIRRATQVIWPDRARPLSTSQRASAVWSVTRLLE